MPSLIDLICKINFVCTSTLLEKTLKENQFVGPTKWFSFSVFSSSVEVQKEPTARLFARFHSPQTERMKKKLILTTCISSIVLNRVIKLRVLPPKQGMYFTVLAIPRSCYVCFSAEIDICILGSFYPKLAGLGFQTPSAHLWFTYTQILVELSHAKHHR